MRDGFERASVQVLADAMEICKPSLNAAYGNKETLFIEALRRYTRAGGARRSALLDEEPDGEAAVTRLLEEAATAFTSCASARGCMLMAEAASQASRSEAVRSALASAMGDGTMALRKRLVRAVADGHLSSDVDVDAMTSYFDALLAGLSTMARNGSGADELRPVVQTAMRAWRRPLIPVLVESV